MSPKICNNNTKFTCLDFSVQQNGEMGPRRDSSVSGASVGGLSRIPTIAKGFQLSMQSSFNLEIDSARGTPVRAPESPSLAREVKKKVRSDSEYLPNNVTILYPYCYHLESVQIIQSIIVGRSLTYDFHIMLLDIMAIFLKLFTKRWLYSMIYKDK